MRLLYHPKIGALFVYRFAKGARALRAATGPNWRSWVFGRVLVRVVWATKHWISTPSK